MNINHAPGCAKQPAQGAAGKDEKKGVHSVRHVHEFGQHPGLLEYIQIMSCAKALRADQLQRAISTVFNVHVESQLLYRTAAKAHEEMFGSSISDVEELLRLETQVFEEGGFLKLFLGDYVAAWQCTLCGILTVPRERFGQIWRRRREVSGLDLGGTLRSCHDQNFRSSLLSRWYSLHDTTWLESNSIGCHQQPWKPYTYWHRLGSFRKYSGDDLAVQTSCGPMRPEWRRMPVLA